MVCQKIQQGLVITLAAEVEINFKQPKKFIERKTVVIHNIKPA